MIKTKGRPPLALPTGQRCQEKHKASDAHACSLGIVEEFLQGEDYQCSLGQVVHHCTRNASSTSRTRLKVRVL